MTATFTLIDDKYSANDSTGRKRIFGTISLTNPYTTNGEVLTISSYFPNKFLGGKVTAVNFFVSAALTGLAHTGTFRGDTSSTTVTVLQLFQPGLSGTASAGLWVDNTTANVSTTTFTVEMIGV